MKKTILVVGATGTVGSAVVDELIKAGHSVRAGTRTPAKAAERAGVTAVHFDYGAPDTFAPALAGTDALFLLSPAGYAQSDALVMPFLDVALSQTGKIVTMTANGVEHDDTIPLRKIELRVARSGLPYVHLRPGWFMQNFHTYWREPIVRDGVIPLPAADSKTAFVDARDIGAAAAVVLANDAHNGKAYALTGPAALTYSEAAEVLTLAAGRPIRYVAIEDAAFQANLAQSGLPPDYAELLTALFGAVRQGFASTVDSALATLLGHTPRSLADYARDHAAQWRSNP